MTQKGKLTSDGTTDDLSHTGVHVIGRVLYIVHCHAFRVDVHTWGRLAFPPPPLPLVVIVVVAKYFGALNGGEH